jgi:hypothetical protein
MTEPLQKVRVLARTEMFLLRVHLRALAKQTILCAAALLVLVLAIAMVNVAGYMFLSARLDPAVAALILATFNAVIGGGLFLIAKSIRPGAEAAMAEEVRDLALAELQADVDAIRTNFQEVRTDVERIRSGLGGLFGGGGSLGGLLHLGPLLDLLTSSLKRAKGK